jgi:formate-dependent nitrite reductase membrane component NrfD
MMNAENPWGWLIVAYLFLAGAGAGAFLAAAAGKYLAPGWSDEFSKAASVVSGPMVIVGTACLVFDLEAGLWQPWRQAYLMSNFTSMITWGVVVLSLFIPIALLYALMLNRLTFIGRDYRRHLPKVEALGCVFALATAGYTGVLIAVINGAPFWNTPALPVLFLTSAISTGLAAAMTAAAVSMGAKALKHLGNFALAHLVFLGIEIVVLLLFVFISLTGSAEAAASASMMLTGALSPYFWGCVVALGLLVPLGVSILEYFEIGKTPVAAVLLSDGLTLFGGISLRAVIIFSVIAPQII